MTERQAIRRAEIQAARYRTTWYVVYDRVDGAEMGLAPDWSYFPASALALETYYVGLDPVAAVEPLR
jgi:hypothetical protein